MSARAPLDLRLGPAATAAWVGAAGVVGVPPAAAYSGGVLALVLLAGAALGALPRAARGAGGRPDRARGRARGQVVLVAAVVAGVLLAGGAQLSARERGGLAALARERAVVEVVGTVTSEALRIASLTPGAPERYRVSVRVDTVDARGAVRAASAPVTVLSDDPWDRVRYGDRVAVGGRLAEAEPGGRSVALLSTSAPPRFVAQAPRASRATAELRAGLVRVCAGLGADARGLVPGLAVGDTSGLDDSLADAVRVSGLTHLVAVSGAHFSLVGALVLGCCALVGLPRRVQAGAACIAMAGFVVLVHPGPSVLRAAAMGAVGVLGLVVGRPARAMAALGASVVLLLVADPWLSRELGFVLSVVATAGLVLLAGPLARRWSPHVGPLVAHALAVPVAAQCVCAPVILLLSPSVTAYAVPANVLAAPAVAPATVLGLLATLVAPWWTGGAIVLAHLAGVGCAWIALVARVAAGLPGAQVAWAPGAGGVVLLVVATVGALVLTLRSAPDPAHAGPVPGRGVGDRLRRVGLRARGRLVAGWPRASPDAFHSPRPGVPHRGPGIDLGPGRPRPGRARLRPRGPAR